MKKLLLIVHLCFVTFLASAQVVTMTFRVISHIPLVSLPQNSPVEYVQYDFTITRTTINTEGDYDIIFRPVGGTGTNDIVLSGSQSITWDAQGKFTPPTAQFPISTAIIQKKEGRILARFRNFGNQAYTYSDTGTSCPVQIAIGNNSITGGGSFPNSGDPSIIAGTVPTGGNNGVFTYQWQFSIDSNPGNAASYGNITGATTKDYDPLPITRTTHYRRIAKTGENHSDDGSNFVTYSIFVPDITNNYITPTGVVNFGFNGGDPSVINGTTPTGGNGTTYTYQWQSGPTDNTYGFTDIAGATSINYDPPAITQTTYYRRVVTSGGQINKSAPVAIRVILPITNNSITYAGTLLFYDSGDPSNITGSFPSGGGELFSYRWEQSFTSATSGFSTIPQATGINYDPPTTVTTAYYRRIATSYYLSNVTSISNVIRIEIVKTGSIFTRPFLKPDVGMCGGFSDIQPATTAWDSDQDQYVDVFYKFNLTATGRLKLSTCRTDEIAANSADLLDASGTKINGVYEPCDLGSTYYYDNLTPGVYYVVMKGDVTSQPSMLFNLRLDPLIYDMPNVSIANGNSTTLTASGIGVANYAWSPSTGLSTTTGSTIIASPVVTTTYTVTGTAASGCSVTETVKVFVSGSVGSTFGGPIVANVEGCGYVSPIIESIGYGNDYVGTAYEDVYFKFTLTSASIVDIVPINYTGTLTVGDNLQVSLLNSSGALLQQKSFGWVGISADIDFPYEWRSLDGVDFRPNLAVGTYYAVVEGLNQNIKFALSMQTPAGYNCRMAKPEELNVVTGLSSEVVDGSGTNIYPNPAEHSFSLRFMDESQAALISIVDMSGRIIKTAVIENNQTIDVSNLPPGFYYVKIRCEEKDVTRKLLIRR